MLRKVAISENPKNINISRNMTRIRVQQLEDSAWGGKSSSQSHSASPEPFHTTRVVDPNEETLHTVISDIWHMFEASKKEPKKTKLVHEVKLKAESLRRKKRRRATLLSVMRAGSTLMLFLSFGLLQFDFSLYLFSVIIGCLVLGLSTFLERGT